MKTKTSQNEHGRFEMRRHDESFGLVCDRCLRPKVTKVEVIWDRPSGTQMRICNGCYGLLMSGKRLP